MKIEELNQEQIEKARSLATDEERLAYLKECGVELDDDMLAEVAGGSAQDSKIKHSQCKKGRLKQHSWNITGKKGRETVFGASPFKVFCKEVYGL